MNPARKLVVLSLAEGVVIVVYALAVFADVDLSAHVGWWRAAVVLAAAVVAAVLFQSWSSTPTQASLIPMAAGLLGGAALASTVVSAPLGEVYASTVVGTIGTLAIVTAVALSLVSLSRTGQDAS